ncbi:MAG: LysM peptidoglycan-binding domain-containing protein, partial [Propionibacteriaceae bacterium]|nr:LysM peptidoglycan-binding domain-containing protein [Propionibacteriaceae bacterium]
MKQPNKHSGDAARVVRGLLSAGVLLLLVIGGLWALLHWGRLDALTSIAWRNIWRAPDDGSLLLGLMTIVGWLAWLMVTGTVAAEAVMAISRGRLHVRLPGAGWLRPAVAALVLSVAGLAVSASGGRLLMTPAAVPDIGVMTGQVDVEESQTASQVDAPSMRPYVVCSGDDLWSLAERFVGSGEKWRVIADANATVVLDPSVDLVPGTLLMMPTAGPVQAVGPAASAALPMLPFGGIDVPTRSDVTVTVQPGDSLWGLAQANLGDPLQWPVIYEANGDTVHDPNLIYPGQRLIVPLETEPQHEDGPLVPPLAGTLIETSRPPASPAAGAGQTQQDIQIIDEGSMPVQTPGDIEGGPVTVDTASQDGDQQTQSADQPESMAAALIGSIGAGLAGALLAGVALHRMIAMRNRPVGRALRRVGDDAQRVETALGQRAASKSVDKPSGELVIKPPSQKATSSAVTSLRDVPGLLGETSVTVEAEVIKVNPPAEPARWQTMSDWLGLDEPPIVSPDASLAVPDDLPHSSVSVSDPVAPPILDEPSAGRVVLGADQDGADVTLDLLDAGLVVIEGTADQGHGMMASMIGQLLAADAESRPEVVIGVPAMEWLATLLDCPLTPPGEAWQQTRRRLMRDIGAPVADPLVVFTDGTHLESPGLIRSLTNVTVVVYADGLSAEDADVVIEVTQADEARLMPNGRRFQAQMIIQPARRALAEIVENLTSEDYSPAPWWAGERPDELAPAVLDDETP